jgi:hypothetical protein
VEADFATLDPKKDKKSVIKLKLIGGTGGRQKHKEKKSENNATNFVIKVGIILVRIGGVGETMEVELEEVN